MGSNSDGWRQRRGTENMSGLQFGEKKCFEVTFERVQRGFLSERKQKVIPCRWTENRKCSETPVKKKWRGPTEKAEAGLMIRKRADISIFRPHVVFLSIFMHHEHFFFASRFTLHHWRAERVWLMVFKGASATPDASLVHGATATDCQSHNGSALDHVFITFKCWFWTESFINQLKTCCGCNFLFHSYQQDPWHFLSLGPL